MRTSKVMVRLDREQVELDENSMWEWQGGNGSTGNAMQGQVRMGASTARLQAADNLPGEGPVRLYANGPWTLVLDVGQEALGAQRLLIFLRRSGYPIKAEPLRDTSGIATWQLLLEGFMSSEAAITMGGRIMGLAPGIVSATYKNKATKTEEPKTDSLRFSDSLVERLKP